MFDIFDESDDFSMDVQVGPEKEIRADINDSPVTIAKKNPDTVCVAGKKNANGVCEFFVDAEDVINLARLNEETILESMNRIIECNEDTGITAQNIIMVMNESNMDYSDELEYHGVNCMRIVSESEMEDISMDVQVGPNGDEVRVSEDPQEANPVDAVKRQYNSVVVAKDGDKFFTDVEDVQKCADLNCESMIETLNGIIAANEDAGVEASNLVVMFNESSDIDVVSTLNEAGVILCESTKSKIRKGVGASAVKIINKILVDNDVSSIRASKGFYNPIQSHKFNKGTTDNLVVRLLYRYNSLDASRDMDKATSVIRKNKNEILSKLNKDNPSFRFIDIDIDTGKVGATMDVIISTKEI